MNHPFQQLLAHLSEDWRAEALCAQISPGDEWHADKGPGCVEQTNFAKAVCRACPVQAACLEYALTNGERFGVWGGLSPNERDELRRRRNMPVVKQPDWVDWHGTEAGAKRHHREGSPVCVRCQRGVTVARRERDRRGMAS